MSVAKIPAIFFIVWGTHITTSPPTPAIPQHERKTEDGPLDIHAAGRIFKVASWLHAAIELTIILGSYLFPRSQAVEQLSSYLLPGSVDACSRIFLTPTTAIAAALMIGGSLIRQECYKEMGRHFTFHVTVLKDHKLITTGLYSIVRHPGYTGIMMNFIGLFMYYFAEGSWLRERFLQVAQGSSTGASSTFAAIAFCFSCFWATTIMRRVPAEDQILKEHFGKEWEQWASRVQYRLIPGVY